MYGMHWHVQLHRHGEVVFVQPVLCVECEGLWETGEGVSIQLTLISFVHLHVIVQDLALSAVCGDTLREVISCVCGY